MISDARIRTICSWLPTLDEARLREVEDFVLAKAIEQQDSAPADTVVPHDGERTHGGNLSAAAHPSNGSHRVGEGDYHPWYGPCDAFGFDSKCSECQRITLHLRRQQVESGLRELAAATPVKAAAPGILLDFDMSDIGDDQ